MHSQTLIDAQKHQCCTVENEAVKGIAAFQKQVFWGRKREKKLWIIFNTNMWLLEISQEEKKGLHYVCFPSTQKSTRVKGYFASSTKLRRWTERFKCVNVDRRCWHINNLLRQSSVCSYKTAENYLKQGNDPLKALASLDPFMSKDLYISKSKL